MRPQVVTVSSQTTSAPIPMDWTQDPFAVGIGVVVSGTLTYSVEHTFDDILNGATANWFPHSTIAAQTTSKDGNYAFPVTAIRLNVTAFTSGSATLNLLQGGNK
jgi:hypothetical protein